MLVYLRLGMEPWLVNSSSNGCITVTDFNGYPYLGNSSMYLVSRYLVYHSYVLPILPVCMDGIA